MTTLYTPEIILLSTLFVEKK